MSVILYVVCLMLHLVQLQELSQVSSLTLRGFIALLGKLGDVKCTLHFCSFGLTAITYLSPIYKALHEIWKPKEMI
jgi:hypothetical protein